MPDSEEFKAFMAWANGAGYDTAHTFDTERSKWVPLNPMTADLWKCWQAARVADWTHVDQGLPDFDHEVIVFRDGREPGVGWDVRRERFASSRDGWAKTDGYHRVTYWALPPPMPSTPKQRRPA